LRAALFADLLAVGVADVDRKESGERVEVALALDVLQVAAFTSHDHGHLAVEVAAHAREVQPEVLLRELLEVDRDLRCRRYAAPRGRFSLPYCHTTFARL